MFLELLDLIDLDQVKNLLKSLSDVTGLAHSLVDTQGQVVCSAGWQDICSRFHRKHPEAAARCLQSDLLVDRYLAPGEYQAYRCANGLMHYGVPISVDGRYLATFFFSQFLHEPPDEDFFIQQAREWGLDLKAYLAALTRVPIVTPERTRLIVGHFVQVVEILAKLGLEKMQVLDTARLDLNAMDSARRQAERNLHFSKKRYQAVVEAMGDPVCCFKPDGQVTLINPAFSRYFALTAADLSGRSLFELLPDGALIKTVTAVTEEARGQAIINLEDKIIRPDGRQTWLEWNCQGLVDEHGQLVEIQAVGRDITRRRLNQLQLEESHEARFRGVFEQAPIGMALLEYPSLKFSKVNQAGRQLIGYSENELKNLTPWDLALTGDREKNRLAREQALGAGSNRFLMESRFVRKDGQIMIANITVSVVRDHAGQIAHLVGMVEDITEKKRAEEALRRSEERYRRITKAMTDYIFTVYLEEGQVSRTEHSPACEAVTGYRPEEMGSEPTKWLDYLPEEDRELVNTQVSLLLDKKEFVTIEHRLIRKDGRIIWVRNTPVPHFDSQGHLIEYDALISDITNQKLAEEWVQDQEQRLIQTEKLASLGTLAAGVAHEINNPTSFIMLNAPILREAWNDVLPILEEYYHAAGDFSVARLPYSDIRQHMPLLANGIIDGAERISNIVKTLKDFARPEPNDQTQLVDLNQVVASCLVLLGNLIKNSTRNFSVDCYPKLPMVRGNRQRLEQVLVNLVQNACQALANRDKGLTISTDLNSVGDEVVLTVKDHGIGMTRENLAHIFDPFFTTKRTQGGTGLGLSICQTIVTEHRGRLEFSSQPGQGTTAKLILPAWKKA